MQEYIADKYKIIDSIDDVTFVCENADTGVKWVLKKTEKVDRGIIENLAQIRHPHIPRVFEILEHNGNILVVYEYLEGVTLRELCEKEGGKIDCATALDHMIQVSKIIHFLHTCTDLPLLHLDIKPSNLIVNGSNEVCIIDMGSISFENGSSNTEKCTGKYAPPELLAGKPAKKESDIYMIGSTFIALTCGIGSMDRYDEIPDKSGIPEKVSSIIGKCIMNRPEDRYRSALSLAKELMTAKEEIMLTVSKDEPSDHINKIQRGNILKQAPSRVIAIWGDPYFASEIAYALTTYGKKVLLIDADLLWPAVDMLLDINKKNRKKDTDERSTLSILMEKNSSGELFPEDIEMLADKSNKEGLYCVTGNYRMEDYEHYCSKGLANIIRSAREVFDHTIIRCNSFIYDEFSCVSFICSDKILIPLIPNDINFRFFLKSVDFLIGRKQINIEKVYFVGFDNRPGEDMTEGFCEEICSGRYLGNIDFSKKRRMLAGTSNNYIDNMETKIFKQYRKLIDKANITSEV